MLCCTLAAAGCPAAKPVRARPLLTAPIKNRILRAITELARELQQPGHVIDGKAPAGAWLVTRRPLCACAQALGGLRFALTLFDHWRIHTFLGYLGQPVILVGNLQHDALVVGVDNLFSKRARFLREISPTAGDASHLTAPSGLPAASASAGNRIRSLEKVSGEGTDQREGVRDGPPEIADSVRGESASPKKMYYG